MRLVHLLFSPPSPDLPLSSSLLTDSPGGLVVFTGLLVADAPPSQTDASDRQSRHARCLPPPRESELLLWQQWFPGLSLWSIIHPQSDRDNKSKHENVVYEGGAISRLSRVQINTITHCDITSFSPAQFNKIWEQIVSFGHKTAFRALSNFFFGHSGPPYLIHQKQEQTQTVQSQLWGRDHGWWRPSEPVSSFK